MHLLILVIAYLLGISPPRKATTASQRTNIRPARVPGRLVEPIVWLLRSWGTGWMIPLPLITRRETPERYRCAGASARPLHPGEWSCGLPRPRR